MRLPPLPAEEWDDEVRAALAGFVPRARQNPDGVGVAVSVMARHPALSKAFFGFSVHLLARSTLSPRVRELAILRIAQRRNCAYEWVHHVEYGKKAGLTDAEIESAGRGEATKPLDRAVLTAVDELDEKSNLSDETWTALSEHLDERQRMDLVLTIGGYITTAMAFNTFGIEPEEKG